MGGQVALKCSPFQCPDISCRTGKIHGKPESIFERVVGPK